MSASGKAVFLFPASQDADAATRICDALRTAGIEVWFDSKMSSSAATPRVASSLPDTSLR